MKKIFTILAAIAAITFSSSCTKDDDVPGSSMDKDLIGTWEGSTYTTYVDDKPFGDPITVTFSFTSSKFVWTSDGKTVVSSPYVCGVNGNKYFQWTEGDTSGGDAIFYSISGKTMTITGASGSILFGLPKTMTKK